MNSLELDLTAQHMDNLIGNLSGFILKVDKIERDGNCFFRAVASQLDRYEGIQGTYRRVLHFPWIMK